MARNTYIADSFGIGDRAKHNRGGLTNNDSLIEQGDTPVNVQDLLDADALDLEMREMLGDDSRVVPTANKKGDVKEGIAFQRSMYPHERIRKNSDY
jgi:hypothetical protein